MEDLPAPVVAPVDALGHRILTVPDLWEALQDPAFRQEIADAVLARAEGREVLSLDIFDTLLVRDAVPEAERFARISEAMRAALPEGLRPADAQDILIPRVEAFRFTYRTRPRIEGCAEGSLDDMLAQIARAVAPGADDIAELVETLRRAEIATEAASLRPNLALIDAIDAFRAQGGRVVLVSDMYIGADDIAEIVEAVAPGLMAKVARLWSSADVIVSKRSGKVFARIEADMGLMPRDFVHFGDSLPGDVLRPRARGWAAWHMPVPRRTIADRRRRLQDFIAAEAAAGRDVREWAKI
jgi:FMN phosphatase YigB (HAD superfamily)